MEEDVHRLDLGPVSWEYRYVRAIVPAFVLLLRLAFGFYFAWSGFDKVITSFSAEAFLLHASSGPLKDVFVDLGQSSTALDVINPLVAYGQVLIGLALIFGLFTRFALLMGGVQVSLFYLAQLWPANNPFLDDHVFDLLTMALLGSLGAGRILGIDGLLEKWQPVMHVKPLQYALG